MHPSIADLHGLKHTDKDQFLLIAGPCAVESRALCFEVAERILRVTERLGIPYIFKASYRKANRSRLDSFRTIGEEKALRILEAVRDEFAIPVTTDIHTPAEAGWAAQVVDVIQIPAFLCRQTDLLVAAAQTGKVVNIKKGQFVSPDAMKFAADKVRGSGNASVWLTERGTFFGYQDLVVDFRSIPLMQRHGCPVIVDCTHSLQRPNQRSGVTGGSPELIEVVARAAVATQADGLFLETHPDPAKALSDGANMLPLDRLESLLERLVALRAVVASFPHPTRQANV